MLRYLIPALLISSPVMADWKEDALALALQEPKVLAAEWTTARTITVRVTDDGTRRDGYAQYICLLISDVGLPEAGSFRARVRAERGDQVLGEADCAK